MYTASKNRAQGREGWSVIFRHPGRLVLGTDQPGRNVCYGLGTTDEAEADLLVRQLNEILRAPQLWEPGARVHAEAHLDPRVIEIFYGSRGGGHLDFAGVREHLLPLPTAADGYRTVMMLGTTGAGKTTVVRQLLGTNPETERFPSTSTAKTTVADTELIISADQTYRAAVTFTPRAELVGYLADNVSAAGLAAFAGKGDTEVIRQILDHVNQRFRFSYVLGRATVPNADDLADDDEDADEDIDPTEYGRVNMELTQQVLYRAVRSVRVLVARHAGAIRDEFDSSNEDEQVVTEYIEENLDTELRNSEEFDDIVDSLIDEIEKRFSTLDVGELRRNEEGWPISWSWSTPDRVAFIKNVTRFSSNYAPLFGRLLTPLVNGIRVSGPFVPDWADQPARLVLVDGEGLGHTPKSVATLSTHVATQLEKVDAVLLVDNATQPMQAAPVAALKGIAVSGNAPKLHFLFTHFDQVKGDNLPTFSAREEHVLASVENVLSAIGDDLGPAAERVLRRRLDHARFFVGGIHEPLKASKKSGGRSIQELQRLVAVLAAPQEAADVGESRPVYSRMNLALAVVEAASTFHLIWGGLLGIHRHPDAPPKEHWARIKALSRRLAEGWSDEYGGLQPVADLRNQLQNQLYHMVQRPVRWDQGEPGDDEKQVIFDELSNALTKRLFALTRRRIQDDPEAAWRAAFRQSGTGSTYERARIIAADVFGRGAPVPAVSTSAEQHRFLEDVRDIFEEVAQELDVVLE
ncbi:hypothetical protein ABT336_21860 [Micromonospora sp. NPDC000207]|uniref:hypothetical protein n=1 Tax=Micromonospora sp. NPDC000207 TaxID=3154246 RepID=UPI003326332C